MPLLSTAERKLARDRIAEGLTIGEVGSIPEGHEVFQVQVGVVTLLGHRLLDAAGAKVVLHELTGEMDKEVEVQMAVRQAQELAATALADPEIEEVS